MSLKPQVLGGWPPGGWQFYQPETDWHAPGPLENTFDRQVDNIVAMRKANPAKNLPTDKAVAAADLEAYTEVRLAKTYSRNGMQKFMVQSAPTPQELKKKVSSGTPFARNEPRGVAGVAGAGNRTAALEEWLGAGGTPIDRELANHRASICENCPANQKAGWRDLITVGAAHALRLYLEIKNSMNLRLDLEDELGVCRACTCPLVLKPWAPIDHIKDNTDEETMEKHRKANAECWVVTES